MKKRILMCAESSHLASGFGKYTKNILQRLHNTDKYEIAELSCNRTESVVCTEPWRVYPAAVNSNHPLYTKYISNPSNQFGQWLFEFVCIDFKPHIVFDIRDYWNFTFQETSHLRNFYHWMIAPTYDSTPQPISIINSFYNADILSFHTEWAKNNLINSYNYTSNNISKIVPDSVDHNIFKPVACSKQEQKQKYGISTDSFIIGSVMRNQKRKLIPDLLETFAKLSKLNNQKNIVLYLHTSYPDGLAWDLPALLLEYNIAHKVLLTYVCSSCHHFFPSVFSGHATICPNCRTNKAFISNVKSGVSEQDLNNIYNLFDVYVQYAICEGFGIPTIEAASCGIPVVSINNEAMKEVGTNVGAELVNIKRSFREQESNAIRSYPDNEHLLTILHRYLNMSELELAHIGNKCRNLCLKNYSWDITAKVFEEIFDNIDTSKKMSWDDMTKREIDHQYVMSSGLNHREAIYSIIDNIIKEPFLKNTSFIEDLIKSANQGYIIRDNKTSSFTVKHYVSILEAYMNNKRYIEELRTRSTDMRSPEIEQILNYNKKSI